MHSKAVAATSILLIIVGALYVAGCTTPAPSNSSGVAITINSVSTSNIIGRDPILASTPHPGNHFVTFNVTVTNVNKDDLTLGTYTDFTLTTKAGNIESPFLRDMRDDAIVAKAHTNPGEQVTGTITFEVPQTAEAATLNYADGVNEIVRVNL